jgi:hypothetical protein
VRFSSKWKIFRHTVACLISPVAVWPAQKTRPGILVAGAARHKNP